MDREEDERQEFRSNVRPDGSRPSGQLHRSAAAGTTRRSGPGDLPVRAVNRATAVRAPPDSEVGFAWTAGAIGDLAGFLDVLRSRTQEGPKNGVHIFSCPFHNPNGAFERALATFDDLEDEELKQRISDIGASNLLEQNFEIPAVPIGIHGKEIAVRVGVV